MPNGSNLATAPVDLRASFNRLFALTQSVLEQDPLSGHWFVFTNQDRNRVKVLFWDGSGLWVCAKRLERGRFGWPAANGTRSLLMRPEELAMLINGMDLTQARPRKNWLDRTPAA